MENYRLTRKIRHDINCESKCTKAGCLGRATWQLETHMGIQYQPKAMIDLLGQIVPGEAGTNSDT